MSSSGGRQRIRGRKKNKRAPRSGAMVRSIGPGTFSRIVVQPHTRKALVWTSFTNIFLAANPGANTTYQLYDAGTTPLTSFAGISSLFDTAGTSTTSMYRNCKVVGVRVKASFSNQDPIPVRVGVSLTSLRPTNNTLTSINSQFPYLNGVNVVSKHVDLGPLTGAGRATLAVESSLKQQFGVAQIAGLSDNFANYWNTTTGALVSATTGLSVVLMVAALANLTVGVACDFEVVAFMEFWGPNPAKLS